MDEPAPGQIVVLNGAPRSGKSSIVAVIQETFDGVWLNLGVDAARSMTPERYQPGIGLRPGEEAHPVAPLLPALYGALYDSIAAHSKAGLNVVVDVGHYDATIFADCLRRLEGLPVLLVGRSLSARGDHGAPAQVTGGSLRHRITRRADPLRGAALAAGRASGRQL